MVDKYLDQLAKWIDQRVTLIQQSLGSGSAKDYVEYKAMVGEIKGLLTARLNIQDLQKNLEESDDD